MCVAFVVVYACLAASVPTACAFVVYGAGLECSLFLCVCVFLCVCESEPSRKRLSARGYVYCERTRACVANVHTTHPTHACHSLPLIMAVGGVWLATVNRLSSQFSSMSTTPSQPTSGGAPGMPTAKRPTAERPLLQRSYAT